MSVEPSTNHAITLRMRNTTASHTAKAGLRWLDANGATISTDLSAGTASSTTAWTTVTHTASSPANAAYVIPIFQMLAPSGVSDFVYLDKVAVRTGTNTTWYPGLDDVVFEIQRSDDNKANWVGCAKSPVLRQYFAAARIRDFGAKRNTVTYFRSRIRGLMAGATVYSSWVESSSVTPNTASAWRLNAHSPNQSVPITGASQVSATSVATFTTPFDHGYVVGDTIIITLAGGAFNGTYTVRSVPTTTTFTVSLAGADAAFAVKSGNAERVLSVTNLRVQGFDNNIEETVGVFRPIGAKAPVTISGDVYVEDGTFGLVTITEAEWTAIEPILTSQDRCCLVSPLGDQRWFKVTKVSFTLSGTATNAIRQANVEYVGLDVT